MGRHLYDRISGTFIYLMEGRSHIFMFGSVKITFVQDYDWRHIIDLAGHQKPVQKRKLHLREIQCHHKKCAVKVVMA